MSNAETFKNNASGYADQAGASASNALESATNASNSASNALDNANKAKEHLDSVNTAVNSFNTDYAQKINEFNTNYATKKEAFDTAVNNANTALNATITEANTSINSKVAEASAQANIAKQEADRATLATDGKLDKNQGTDNAGKAMVVDEEGNIIPGEAGINNDEVNALIDSAIKEKLYTQEEVDYLLRDKMDKPYVPITITDNATINDALEGNFKIDTIKGNTYQNVETDIVPTPNRPVPINSRKVKAGDEYVELRSLKESENLFDEKLAIHGYVTSAGEIVSSNVGKRNEKLSDFIPTNNATQLSFYINVTPSGSDNDIDTRLWYGISFYDSNKTFISRVSDFSDYTIENITVTNTINVHASAKYFRFSYRAYEDGKASVVLGAKTINSYIPPTVRDYKIVDHANKTAKIIRNVRQRLLTAKNNFYRSGYGGMEINLKDGKLMNRNESAVTYCNLFNHHVSNTIPNNLCYRLDNNYLQFNYEGYNEKTLWDKFITDNELYIQYQLATPVEETITYVETDTSEVGYSWQDTTSPSPSIKSEVQGVEEIDILKTGKNLFDFSKVKKSDDLTIDYENKTITIMANTNNAGYVNNLKDLMGGYKIGEKYVMSAKTSNAEAQRIIYFLDIKKSIKFDEPFTLTEEMLNSPFSWYNNIESKNQNVISNIQIEQSNTATAYEPYAGQPISITPPQPLYQNDIVNVESGDYEYYTKNTTIDFNRFYGNLDLIQENTVRYYFHKNFVQEFDGIILDTLLFDCFTNVNDDSDMIHFKIGGANNEYIFMYIPRGHIDNKAYAKEYLSSLNLIANFAVENKTTQPIPEDDLAKLKSLKTNVGVNNIFINSEVKPSIEARYPQNVVLAVNRLQTKLLTLQKEVVKNV